MTEIVHAQRRLLDDEGSTAAQPLPSTATAYPSEPTQPGSFPSMSNYPYQQVAGEVNDTYTYTRAVAEDSYEATQLIEPPHVNGYDYSTPATSNNVDSPFGDPNETADKHSHDASSHKSAQRSKSMQPQLWSPHDTEPLSSAVSPGLSRSKSDNARSGLMSLQYSQGSAHDELALHMVPPVTATNTSAVKKKRGRPKKQSLPEDDEDDELAAPRDYELELSRTAEKRRWESPSKNQEASRQDVIEINGDEEEPSTTQTRPQNAPRLMVVLPVAFDGESRRNDAGVSTESEIADTKPPKKKKVKRSKTASAVLDKPNEADVDGDVIWLDTSPVQIDKPKPVERADDPEAQDAPLQVNRETPQAEEPSARKSRGRKRKKTADQLAAEEQQQPQEAETAAPDTALDENPGPILVPLSKPGEPTKETATTEVLPPTHPRAEGKENDPTTAKDSHKGPSNHSPILSTTKVPYRVGLSKRARIAPLLKVVRK